MQALFIADDNIALTDLVVRAATRRGWRAMGCANGADLLDALATWERAALVLIDMQMPELDGFETLERLLGLPNARDLRIRFITGGPESSAIAARMIGAARELDVGPTLLKPIRMATLERLLDFEQTLLQGRT